MSKKISRAQLGYIFLTEKVDAYGGLQRPLPKNLVR